jgi:hypothetical protein
MPMKPMPMREFAAAFLAFPRVSARTICGATQAAPAENVDLRKRRRPIEDGEFIVIITLPKNRYRRQAWISNGRGEKMIIYRRNIRFFNARSSILNPRSTKNGQGGIAFVSLRPSHFRSQYSRDNMGR